jgi:hypothetical protein
MDFLVPHEDTKRAGPTSREALSMDETFKFERWDKLLKALQAKRDIFVSSCEPISSTAKS